MFITAIVSFLTLFLVIVVPIMMLCIIVGAIYKGPITYVEQVSAQGNKVMLKVHYRRGKPYITTVKFGSQDHKAYMKYLNH